MNDDDIVNGPSKKSNTHGAAKIIASTQEENTREHSGVGDTRVLRPDRAMPR